MKSYEYDVVDLRHNKYNNGLGKINAKGKQGWRLVAVVHDSTWDTFRYFFERELPGEPYRG